jgi:CRP-like cAMP-binding protein
MMLTQGDAPQLLYLVVSGAAKLIRSERDRRDVIVAIRTPGWLLGVASAVLGEPHPVSACAMGWCDVLPIPLSAFRSRDRLGPKFRHAVESMLAGELFEQVMRAGRNALPVPERIERLLVDLARTFGRETKGGGTRIGVRMTQAEIADLVVTSRESVNVALRVLEKRGDVGREGGWLVITKGSKLSRIKATSTVLGES